MRVATFNLRHAELRGLEPIARAIAGAGADVVGLQEVDRGVARSVGVDQAAWLAGALGMAHAFVPALALEGGDYGCALLVRPHLAPDDLRAQAVALPGGAGPGEEPRVALRAALPDRVIWVVHLDLPEGTRALQGVALAEAVRPEAPRALVLGDFNEGLMGPSVQPLLALGLRDGWSEAGASERSTAPLDRPQGRIDLVLLGGALPRARAAGAVEPAAAGSDHPLVWVDA